MGTVLHEETNITRPDWVIDGVNKTFPLSNTPDPWRIKGFNNGLFRITFYDSDGNEVGFIDPPASDDSLLISCTETTGD